MLTQKEADNLAVRMESLSCTDPKAGDGLFSFVLGGEQGDRKPAYDRHTMECEYCRNALELYRYKRDAIKLFGKWETGKQIIAKAMSGAGILKRQLGNGTTAYFQAGRNKANGTTVIVDAAGGLLAVEEQSVDEFNRLH